MPSADHTARADQFHGLCERLYDGYIEAIETDMNNFYTKNGKPMDYTFAHNDLTRMFARDIKPNVLAGVVAEAVLREISKKLKGKG